MSPLFTAFIALLFCTVPLAYLSGWVLSRERRVKAGHIREVMPSLPTAPSQQGDAEKRWDKSMRRVERKMIDHFLESGATGVHAMQLAGQLGEQPEIVEAVLARMREETPCRMRILRSGTILHDFETEDLEALKRARRLSVPKRLLFATLAVFANIGAAWPFISVVIIVLMTFRSMQHAVTEDLMVQVGLTGIMYSVGIMLATIIMGWIAKLLFTSTIVGPKLGAAGQHEHLPRRASDPSYADSYLPFVFFHNSSSSHYSSSSSSYGGSSFSWGSSGSSSSSESDSSFDFGDAEGEGAAIVIIVVILVVILGAALTAIGVWLRGMWRAAARLNEPPLATSPTLWVRTAQAIDKWEKYLPTNDLVIRALHAIRRQVSFRRPPDDDLAARILILAKQKNGVLTGLDIAFHEGLDLNEAHEVGARLSGLLDGQILLDNEGELAFAFPPSALKKLVAEQDGDMWAEYVTFTRGGVRRRLSQEQTKLPVNLVGLTRGHLHALARLVAGTYLMAITAGYFVLHLSDPLPLGLEILALAALFMMVLATSTLMTTAYSMAKINVEHGVRRDVRRTVFKHIQNQVDQRQSTVSFDELTDSVERVFKPSWRGFSRDLVAKEIRGVVIDLELDPVAHADGQNVEHYDLTALTRRLTEDSEFAQVFDFERVELDFQSGGDEVVFDTKIEHAQVTALGHA